MARLPKVKLRAIPVFPTTVEGGNAITVTKENGQYSIDLDVSDFNISGVATADELTTYAISWGGVTDDNPDGAFQLVPYATIQSASDDLTSLADLGTTGIVTRIGDADFTTRSVAAGTGLGVTNGDGVSGNPTVAITDVELLALAGLTSAADKLPYFTGSGTASLTDFSAFARTLLDDANQAAMRTTLGLTPGTDVQAFDADLSALAANSTDGLWAHTGAGTGAARTLTAPAAGLTITNPAGIAGNPTFALANDLAALEALSGTNTIYYRSAADTWTAVTIGAGLSFSGGSLTASGSSAIPGYLNGLTLSNNATDATNDIDIAAGSAAENSSSAVMMTLSSALTKRLDAAWAVGTGNGGLDTGSIANTTYHVFLIQRSDTGVVDALFSTSPSAPTMPANYDRKRRIGSILRESAAIVLFDQTGDLFKRRTQLSVRNSTTLVTDVLLDMKTPAGIKTLPLFIADMQLSAAGSGIQLMSDGDRTAAGESINRVAGTEYSVNIVTGHFVTNTSSQVRFTLLNSSGTLSFARIQTQGWIDGRDR